VRVARRHDGGGREAGRQGRGGREVEREREREREREEEREFIGRTA
jgi:hypothetical protein